MKNILSKKFTDKSFASAVKQVFDGVRSRQENIQEFLLIATDRITGEHRDTGWLNIIAAQFEATAGLSTDKFALWVKTSIVADTVDENDQPIVIPALAWDDKTNSFKFARKGLQARLVCTQKWYECGKKPSVAQSYNLIGSLESLIRKAEKELKEGNLDEQERALLNAIVGVKVQYAKPTIQMAAKVQEQAQAAADAGVI